MKIGFIGKTGQLIILSALFTVLLSACTDRTLDPIFWTLANEQSLDDDRGFNDSATVHKMIKEGNNYFAAANQILFRAVGEDIWKDASPEEGHSLAGAFCKIIEAFQGFLYAGFVGQDEGLGLWRADPTSLIWEKEYNGEDTGENVQIIMLKTVNDRLFVSTARKNDQDEFEYSLYYYDDLSTFKSTNLSSLLFPITDITYDSSNYWVVSGPSLYGGSLDSLTLESGDAPKPNSTKPFGGVYYTSGKLYLSSEEGKMYKYEGEVWSNPTEVTPDEEPVPFTEFVEVDSDLFVGTEGFGYYRLPSGSIESSEIERSPDYNISDLYNGVILRFFWDEEEDKVFACTAGAGLWRADREDYAWVWVQE